MDVKDTESIWCEGKVLQRITMKGYKDPLLFIHYEVGSLNASTLHGFAVHSRVGAVATTNTCDYLAHASHRLEPTLAGTTSHITSLTR